MARPREELQLLLESILGSRQVYFQPPETIRMAYPAIVYSLSSVRKDFADNAAYFIYKAYDVTVIDYDPDSGIADKVGELPFCRFNRMYKSDDLNHFMFTIYY